MIRLIVLAVAVAVVVWAILRTVARILPLLRALKEAQAGAAKSGRQKERFVACARCGLHVPESRALQAPGSGQEVYCSSGCLEPTHG